MAEVRKREKRVEYTVDKKKKTTKKNSTKKAVKPVKKEKVEEKKSLWTRFRIFCHGVKSETSKVHWPSKDEMVKYSIATVLFIVFCSLFFYLINILFALLQSVLN